MKDVKVNAESSMVLLCNLCISTWRIKYEEWAHNFFIFFRENLLFWFVPRSSLILIGLYCSKCHSHRRCGICIRIHLYWKSILGSCWFCYLLLKLILFYNHGTILAVLKTTNLRFYTSKSNADTTSNGESLTFSSSPFKLSGNAVLDA